MSFCLIWYCWIFKGTSRATHSGFSTIFICQGQFLRRIYSQFPRNVMNYLSNKSLFTHKFSLKKHNIANTIQINTTQLKLLRKYPIGFLNLISYMLLRVCLCTVSPCLVQLWIVQFCFKKFQTALFKSYLISMYYAIVFFNF